MNSRPQPSAFSGRGRATFAGPAKMPAGPANASFDQGTEPLSARQWGLAIAPAIVPAGAVLPVAAAVPIAAAAIIIADDEGAARSDGDHAVAIRPAMAIGAAMEAGAAALAGIGGGRRDES